MPKALTITAEIERLMKANSGDEGMETANQAVFEVILLNTKPLTKRGSIFDRGVVAHSTLLEMAAHFNGKTIPLHIDHLQGGGALPVGRVFHATVKDTGDGHAELRGLFYIPRDKAQLVSDIENSVIDEVSVGFLAQKLLCSECGWDYFGAEADFMNFFERTCANGHTLGEDGAHTRSVGVDRWYETSLVSIGAADNPKIVSRARSVLSGEERERLAASGRTPEAVVLFATTKETKPMATDATKVELGGVAEVLTKIETLTAAVTKHEATVTELTAQVAALTTERDQLKAAATNPAEIADLNAKLTAANATIGEVKTFLTAQVKAALVAAGQKDPQVPEDLAGMLTAITESKLKLHQLVNAGGSSGADAIADADGEDKAAKAARVAAFKTRN